MCGIIGFTGERSAVPILLDGLKRLEYRGYDSAGVAVFNDGKICMSKAAGQLSNLREKIRDSANLTGNSGIGHTRWATHGAPTETNAHPHISNNGKFSIVHNGIIENYESLREELKEKGFDFYSQTDTEVIVHLLEYYYGFNGDFKAAIMKTASRLAGSYALGIICTDAPGKIFAIRESSPLIIGVGAGENYFASDVTALVENTRNVIYLEDGEFAELTPCGVTVYDCIGRKVDKTVTRVAWDVEAAEKGGYEHFMLKEIMEQPRALKSTIEPRVKQGRVEFEGLELDLSRVRKIIITACGSAYYAGCVGRYVIEELCRLPVEVELASELRYRNPIADEHTLLIAISQSGETADTIGAIKECRSRGASVLAIVNVVGSTIAKLADNVIYTWAGPEIAVATTKGYTTQLAVLDLFALYAADELGRIGAERYRQLLGQIMKLPMLVQRALDFSSNIPALAGRYHKNRTVFFIGRNIDCAVGLEGSLKLKEISYLHSEAYPAGELKHGTIALIDPDRLVVALACHEALLDKMTGNIQEVKARGATVLAVAQEGTKKIVAEADDVIFVPRAEPLFIAAVEIVPLQLFAYYIARNNGCDIDKPKNLAKSVTVE
ncbi:MAG: glutamine--fructose-6-phosphate transaminase (isomerizing) [Clostridiales bacterium]|nr:glutamine--fructose-6-phosphate transaminase (isomerizing) [Clostridiales bacterium]